MSDGSDGEWTKRIQTRMNIESMLMCNLENLESFEIQIAIGRRGGRVSVHLNTRNNNWQSVLQSLSD